MAFVKLDTGILNSTIWVQRPDLEIFITALLLAEPVELLENTQTIKIRTLDADDFVIPPGWYGFVAAAGPGIVHRAHIDNETGLAALERLAQADIGSRSQGFNGRRLVRIDGGFIVLNFMRYRDRDHTAAERQRRLRERRRNGQVVTRDVNAVTRDATLQSRDITDSRVQIADADKQSNTIHGAAPLLELALEKPPLKAAEIPYEMIIDCFHKVCPTFPRVTKLSESRKKAIRARYLEAGENPPAWFQQLFEKAAASDFISGRNGKWNGGGFDWLMNPANSLKVIEGNYTNKGEPGSTEFTDAWGYKK